jgi:hypothetical protein
MRRHLSFAATSGFVEEGAVRRRKASRGQVVEQVMAGEGEEVDRLLDAFLFREDVLMGVEHLDAGNGIEKALVQVRLSGVRGRRKGQKRASLHSSTGYR